VNATIAKVLSMGTILNEDSQPTPGDFTDSNDNADNSGGHDD
jgi:hypothetical protein